MKIRKIINEAADPTLGGVSYSVQGTPGYTYAILPLSHSLEQKTNKHKDFRYIHPGCTVKGTSSNDATKQYTGLVTRIVKDSSGAIKFVYIKTLDTNKFVTINADSTLKLITHTKNKERTTPVFNMNISHNMKI